MRRRLCRPDHEIRCKNLQGWKGNDRQTTTQRRQQSLECSPCTERNASITKTTLGKRCHQKRPDEARPDSFPTRLRIQSTTLHFPPCHPTWSLQILARPDHDPHHQAPSQITSNQQGSSTHGTAKHPVDQDHHRPRPSNITRHHPLLGAKQPTNECHLRSHTNRSKPNYENPTPTRQASSPYNLRTATIT